MPSLEDSTLVHGHPPRLLGIRGPQIERHKVGIQSAPAFVGALSFGMLRQHGKTLGQKGGLVSRSADLHFLGFGG